MIEAFPETSPETLAIVPSKARLLVEAVNKTRPRNRKLPITDEVVGDVAESLLGIYLDSTTHPDVETEEIDDVSQRRAQVLVKYILADLRVEGKYRLCVPRGAELSDEDEQGEDEELQCIAQDDSEIVPTRKGALDVVNVRKEIVATIVPEIARLRASNDAMTVTVRSPGGQGQLRVLDIHDVNPAARDTFLAAILDDEKLAVTLKESVDQKFNFPKEKDETLNNSSNKLLIAALQLYFSHARRNFVPEPLAQGVNLVDFLEGEKVDDAEAVIEYARDLLNNASKAKS